jgi:hypothetical protein
MFLQQNLLFTVDYHTKRNMNRLLSIVSLVAVAGQAMAQVAVYGQCMSILFLRDSHALMPSI